jgi:1-acyl-sn-glycerol-3-phosphate acyltransferase
MMRRLSQVACTMFLGVRVFNRQVEPAQGSAVYICNHQSFVDPLLMAMALRRPMNFMARDSLFRWAPFRWLIDSVNAFPVRRGTADLTAMKEAMRRLKKGEQVVLFAEGTRTRNGCIAPLLPGVALLAKRLAQWTVPVVIDGAFECWPRSSPLPSPGNIVVQYGTPKNREDLRKRDPRELMVQIRQEMIEIQTDIRRRVGRPALDYENFIPPIVTKR